KNEFKGFFQAVAFYGSLILFAVGGSLASVFCAIPSILFRGTRARFFGQRLIHALFRIFIGYLRAFGLIEFDARELSKLRGAEGLIVVANHPGLLDAVLVVSQLPRAVCLMKGSLAHNIIFSGTARLAGYIHNE